MCPMPRTLVLVLSLVLATAGAVIVVVAIELGGADKYVWILVPVVGLVAAIAGLAALSTSRRRRQGTDAQRD